MALAAEDATVAELAALTEHPRQPVRRSPLPQHSDDYAKGSPLSGWPLPCQALSTMSDDDCLALRAETEAALAAAADLRAWDAVRVGVLGKQRPADRTAEGARRRLPPEQRRERGAALNRLRDELTAAIEARRRRAGGAPRWTRGWPRERIDVTLPPRPRRAGLIHPISRTMEEMAAIFGAMGFRVAEGPDIETDWYNFGALNIPAHHPARADHDTFYLPGERDGRPLLLRTHTSDVQIITMLEQRAAAAGDRARPHLPRRPRRDAQPDVPPVRGAGASTATSRSAT